MMGEMADIQREEVIDEAIANDEARCSNCDWPEEPNDRYCVNCGNRLEEENG